MKEYRKLQGKKQRRSSKWLRKKKQREWPNQLENTRRKKNGVKKKSCIRDSSKKNSNIIRPNLQQPNTKSNKSFCAKRKRRGGNAKKKLKEELNWPLKRLLSYKKGLLQYLKNNSIIYFRKKPRWTVKIHNVL